MPHVPITIVDALSRAGHTDPARPLFTYYDDASGERIELSTATVRNWVAKTANLLVDGEGLGRGELARVALPPHWQAAVVLLGCWTAGLAVALQNEPGAPVAPVGFGTADTVAQLPAAQRYALALAPLAAPFRPGPPSGTLDYVLEVRAFADGYTGPTPQPGWAATPDLSHADLIAHAATRAAARLAPTGPAATRLLVDADATPDPIDWLVAPLLLGASIVWCRNLDAAALPARLATERATRY